MPESLLDGLIERSREFESTLESHFGEQTLALADSSPRCQLCAMACLLSLEHAFVVRSAFGSGAPNSGAAMLRLQYEALLRAAWALFAASETQVDKLSRVLDIEAEQAAKNSPGAAEMLDAVSRKAPAGLAAPLQEFH